MNARKDILKKERKNQGHAEQNQNIKNEIKHISN